VLDWHSRKALAHGVSITMEENFCVEALSEAIARFGAPKIVNSDQGSQFTSTQFTNVIKSHGIANSMDRRSQWGDNVFVERLWKSVKYEEVYMKAYKTVSTAREHIGHYVAFCNASRPHWAHRAHRAHERQTPDAIYFGTLTPMQAAA
jgi:putative transposase